MASGGDSAKGGAGGESQAAASPNRAIDAPIGIFDSGYGGLTVLREIAALMPSESTVFVGDTAHFPYGPRDLDEVRSFVLDICGWLVERGCKLVVIACNTATAAGLKAAQRAFGVPVIGVVEPGSRAAVHVTRNRRVGVIATQGTVDTGAYSRAIHNLDAGIDVLSVATPKFVDIAEMGLQFQAAPLLPGDPSASSASSPSLIVSHHGVLDCDSGTVYQDIAEEYLAPLRAGGIDTLVLGCTHFPLIQPLVQDGVGADVTLVSSAEETAREVREVLMRRGELSEGTVASREYHVTGARTEDFQTFGSLVMGTSIGEVAHLDVGHRAAASVLGADGAAHTERAGGAACADESKGLHA